MYPICRDCVGLSDRSAVGNSHCHLSVGYRQSTCSSRLEGHHRSDGSNDAALSVAYGKRPLASPCRTSTAAQCRAFVTLTRFDFWIGANPPLFICIEKIEG